MATNRRELLKGLGYAAVGGYLGTSRGYAANETITVGCIGTGGRTRVLMKALARIPGVRIAAVCDVWDTNLATAKELADPQAFATKEYRQLLDRKDIDAVVIGSPNHQHVPMLTAACSAGKDVYIEKPLTHRLAEGPAALEVQNRYNRIVQVGMQQRSMPQFQKGYELVKSGQLGPIRKVHLTWNRNAARGAVVYHIDPATVDWKAWLGNARPQPFDPYRFREWRWYWDFGGGVLADLMVHYIDIAHWYLDVDHPDKAMTIGNKFTVASEWETPDTAQTLLQYPERPGLLRVHFPERAQRRHAGVHGHGSHALSGSRPLGGVSRTQARRLTTPIRRLPTEPEMQWVLGTGPKGADFYDVPDGEVLHLSNWLECVRSRQTPNAPVEAGISAASAAHLGNIALRKDVVAHWETEAPKA